MMAEKMVDVMVLKWVAMTVEKRGITKVDLSADMSVVWKALMMAEKMVAKMVARKVVLTAY